VAYDEVFADRIRTALIAELGPAVDIDERKMFGGLAFLVGGNMAVCISGRGGLMVRAGRDEADRLIATGAAEPMEMSGRPMGGWLYLEPQHLRTARQLADWVAVGAGFARSLPPK